MGLVAVSSKRINHRGEKETQRARQKLLEIGLFGVRWLLLFSSERNLAKPPSFFPARPTPTNLYLCPLCPLCLVSSSVVNSSFDNPTSPHLRQPPTAKDPSLNNSFSLNKPKT